MQDLLFFRSIGLAPFLDFCHCSQPGRDGERYFGEKRITDFACTSNQAIIAVSLNQAENINLHAAGQSGLKVIRCQVTY